MVITVWSGKGGVSKSTTVAHLAYLWRERNPLVIDIDSQQAQDNFDTGVEVLSCEPHEAPLRISRYKTANPSGLVLIDARPDREASWPVLRAADAILIPLLCERLAIRAHMEGVEALKTRLPKTPRAAFIAMYSAPVKEDRDLAREAWGDEILQTQINKAKAVQLASIANLTVLQSAPTSPAARQFIRLAKELEQRWNL